MRFKLVYTLALLGIFSFGLSVMSQEAQEVAPAPPGPPPEHSQVSPHHPNIAPAPRPQGPEHSQSPAINCPCMGMMGMMGMMGRPGGAMGGPEGLRPGQPDRPESPGGMGMAMGMRPPMDEGRRDEMRERTQNMRQKMEEMRDRMEEGRHSPEGGHDQPLAERLMHGAKDLNLSEKQVAALRSVITSTQKDSIRKGAELQIAQIELKEVGHQDNPDLNQVKAKLQAISSLEADLRFARFKADAEAMALLTEEQRAKVKEHLFQPHDDHDEKPEKMKEKEKKEKMERQERPEESKRHKE